MATKNIDFNSDLAQGFGVYKNDLEFDILDYVSSVNISCGSHAGDPIAIKNALLKCKEKNLAIGAHIGFADISGCGYRPMKLDEDEVEALVMYQIGALASFAKTFNLNIEHVRPHGAMYKLASENYEFSLSIAKAIKKFDKWLTYYGEANQNLEKVSEETGLVIAREVFINRPYTIDGKVDWDSTEKITQDVSLNRIRTILHSSQMKMSNGSFVSVNCDSIHFNCKNIEDIELAKKANELLTPTPVNYNKVELSGWVN